MTAIKSLVGEVKLLDVSNGNQDLLVNETSNAKCQKEVVISNCEVRKSTRATVL